MDFAFKKIFGSPENSAALIGLLNAILDRPCPVTDVTILNPFSYQEFKSAKRVVLDVKAKDSAGCIINIEMQISIHPALLQRLVYYASDVYASQLEEGDDYTELKTTISICLLTGNLFKDSSQAHYRFQLTDAESGRKLDRAIEIHTVELRKFVFSESTISTASPLAQWSWLILNAHNYTADQLRRLFPALTFQRAIGCLEAISSKTEDRAMHDQREKAQRDYDWMLASARKEGIEEGREEGIEQGREEGREEGAIIGSIQTLQQILGDAVSDIEELSRQTAIELKNKQSELQTRLRSRLG